MTATKRKKCPNCKKINEALWHQICGMRLLEENKDGKMCYKAMCPECGFSWHVLKRNG